MKRSAPLIVVVAVALGACAGVTNSPADRVSVTDPTGPTNTTMPDRTASTQPEQVPPEENPLPDNPVDTSAVPADLMAKIMADASTRSGVPGGDIVAVRAEQALWNDGSLGCPQPGMSYTQALVDGYWIVLRAGDQLLDYRASTSGFFVFCDTAFPGAGGAPNG